MGTFGTDAFSSDGAMDFLEQLAERPLDRRVATLEHMFKLVKDRPELLWKEFFPDEVVAGAAIVAASLPGGEPFAESLADLADDDVAPDVRLPVPAPDLVNAALEALLFVAGPDGPWHQGWTSEADADEARRMINAVSLVLDEASRRI